MSVEQTHNKFVKSLADQTYTDRWSPHYMKRVATSKTIMNICFGRVYDG